MLNWSYNLCLCWPDVFQVIIDISFSSGHKINLLELDSVIKGELFNLQVETWGLKKLPKFIGCYV